MKIDLGLVVVLYICSIHQNADDRSLNQYVTGIDDTKHRLKCNHNSHFIHGAWLVPKLMETSTEIVQLSVGRVLSTQTSHFDLQLSCKYEIIHTCKT